MLNTATFQTLHPFYVPNYWDKRKAVDDFLTRAVRYVKRALLPNQHIRIMNGDLLQAVTVPIEPPKPRRKPVSSNPGRRNKCKNPPPKGMRGFGYMRSQYGALAA